MHAPVLLKEAIENLAVKAGGIYIDGTVGGGGHAEAIMERVGGAGRLLGIDRDPVALEQARARLARFSNAVLVQGVFSSMIELARGAGIEAADGVLLDLGVSSMQLDAPERGFSFRSDGPLDMRMDPNLPRTAADLVNTLPETALADLLWRYGEERASRRIARWIVAARARAPIRTTGELADLVCRAVGRAGGRIHPATRTFQALRIAVNDELGELERGLEAALGLLKPGGRLVVISFHSLEDRIVKQTLGEHVGRRESLPGGGERIVVKSPQVAWVTRGVITPGPEEIRANPRARSARLRAVERLAGKAA